jgi:hypothetical protein
VGAKVGAIVGYEVGAYVGAGQEKEWHEYTGSHACCSALRKLLWVAEQACEEDDDRDRHDDSSASHAEHVSHAETPGFENWPLGQGVQVEEKASAKVPAGQRAQLAPGDA